MSKRERFDMAMDITPEELNGLIENYPEIPNAICWTEAGVNTVKLGLMAGAPLAILPGVLKRALSPEFAELVDLTASGDAARAEFDHPSFLEYLTERASVWSTEDRPGVEC